MPVRGRSVKTVIFCVVVLCVVAAAAFYSMNTFERDLFDKYRPLQLCFAVMAASMCFALLCRRSAVTLIVCSVAAAGMWFCTPIYVGFFFPVVLQTVLSDAAGEQRKSDAFVFYAALTGNIGTLFLWPHCMSYDSYQFSGYGAPARPPERIVYFVFFALLLIYDCFLAVRYQNGQKRFGDNFFSGTKNGKTGAPEKRTTAKTAIQLRKNKAAAKRGLIAISICAVNALSQFIYGIVFFKVEYGKAFFFAQVLFLLFLVLRQSPALWPSDVINRFFDAALQQDDNRISEASEKE